MHESKRITWTDGHGREVTREVKTAANAEDLRGTAIYPWVILAANPRLSSADLELFLDLQDETTPGCARSLSWIKRRRWMSRPPGIYRRNRDGRDEVAVKIMADNPTVSIRSLVLLLRDRGIKRGREWVRLHRADGLV